jgi:hypothetical protein
VTRAKRTRVALAVIPAAGYVVLMALIAALWVKPPLLGWIGFAIVAVVGAGITVAVFTLFPRSRTNIPSVVSDGRERLLVLADATCSPSELCESVAVRCTRDVPVHVVAPVLPNPINYIADVEEREREDAERRLAATLEELHAAGIEATGSVGTDEPLQSVGDALARFPATELLIVTTRESQWLEDDLLERARQVVPSVEQVVATPAQAAS